MNPDAQKMRHRGDSVFVCLWRIDLKELLELRDYLVSLGERAGVEFIIFDSFYAFDNMPDCSPESQLKSATQIASAFSQEGSK